MGVAYRPFEISTLKAYKYKFFQTYRKIQRIFQENRFSRWDVYKVQTYKQTHIHFYIYKISSIYTSALNHTRKAKEIKRKRNKILDSLQPKFTLHEFVYTNTSTYTFRVGHLKCHFLKICSIGHFAKICTQMDKKKFEKKNKF